MNYTVFDSTNMLSTKRGARIFDVVADTDIENGTFGYLDGVAEGETVIYNFVAGYKKGSTVVVVDNPAWDADTCHRVNQRKDKYINKAGIPFRVREVKINDKFAISIDGVTKATQEKMDKDAYVTIDATTGKLVASETASESNPIMEAVVEYKNMRGGALVTSPAVEGGIGTTYGHKRAMYTARVIVLA